jgi:hypothetical protein
MKSSSVGHSLAGARETTDQLTRLGAIRPPVGDRYADMAAINR